MELIYNVNLEDVNFHKDKQKNCYLSLKYKIENSDGSVDSLIIPSVRLPILNHSINISNDFDRGVAIDCGFGDLPATKGRVKTQNGKTVKDVYFVKERIKEAPAKEMTLDEIEKRLGYKVKIVNQKGDENGKSKNT